MAGNHASTPRDVEPAVVPMVSSKSRASWRIAASAFRLVFITSIAFAATACARPSPPAPAAAPGTHEPSPGGAGDLRSNHGPGSSAAPSTPVMPREEATTDRATGVPRIDAGMKAHLRRVFALGAREGMRADVFAKIGDSITESGSFLQDVGHGWFDLGPHTDLAPTIEFFRRTHLDDEGTDAFTRASVAAVSGWTSGDALEGPAPDAVQREITAVRPAFALVMFGTNDIDRGTPDSLGENLRRIVAECESRGVIAVLSTIPRRADGTEPASREPVFNAAIRAIATERGIPLMDLRTALEPLARHGLGSDGIHPSAYTTPSGDVQAANLRPEGLRNGYNARNLLALQTLGRLRAIVIEDGAPDR